MRRTYCSTTGTVKDVLTPSWLTMSSVCPELLFQIKSPVTTAPPAPMRAMSVADLRATAGGTVA